MELKTLKDLVKYARGDMSWIRPQRTRNYVKVAKIRELKQEAIKHIKKIREQITVDTKIKDKCCGHNQIVRYNYFDNCIQCDSWIYTGRYEQTQTEQWIKDFFNITEEDLK